MLVLEREVDDVERAEAAVLAEDVLGAAVVQLRVEAEALAGVVEREAGQRPRRFADVLLRVAVVRAEREELEELAREVLVRRLVAGAREVEPDLHRAVAHEGARERAEVAERVAAQRALLAHHQLDVADLVVRRRPVVVPVERHALDQRMPPAHHAVEPPQDVVAVLVDGVDRPAVDARLGALERRTARMQELVHELGVRALAAQIARARAEARPPPQPFDHGRLSSRACHHAPFLACTTSTARIPRAS